MRIVAAEERKGSNGREALDTSDATEEMYDDFDADAVQLGAVDMMAIMNSGSAPG